MGVYPPHELGQNFRAEVRVRRLEKPHQINDVFFDDVDAAFARVPGGSSTFS